MTIDRTLKSLVIPPPVQGWNTKDPISAMDPTFALELENYFPSNGTVDLRGGRTRFSANTLGGSLHVFKYGLYDKLIFSNGVQGLSDISAGGAGTDILGAVVTNSGFIYSQQYKDRIFLSSQSTADNLYYWTGTGTITAAGFSGPSSNDKDLGPMTVYKGRLYLAQLTAPSIWYTKYDSATGTTLTEFPLSLQLRMGGSIAFIGTTTRAKDFNEDELFVAVTTEGEIFVYAGQDASSTSWQLLGHYFIPKPLGPKAFFYIGSSLVIITSQGLLSMGSIMGGDYSSMTTASTLNDLSRNISNQFTEASKLAEFGFSSGFPRWCGCNYPRGNYVIINVPTTSESTTNLSVQFVMNTITGAWCKFTGWPANSFTVWRDRLYMVWGGAVGSGGTGSAVWLCDEGYADYDSSNAIQTRSTKLRPAYNFFGDPSRKKRMLFAIPHMYQSEGMQLTMDADMDFQNVAATQTVTPDNADTSYKYYAPKVGLNGYGKCASIRIDQTVTTKRMSLQAIEVFYEQGTVL